MAIQKVNGTQSGIHSAYSSASNKNLNTYRASGMVDMENNPGGLAITTTNIEVWSNGVKVGFMQSASPSESRNIVKVQELGTEGVVQAVPGNTNGGQLSISRFALYNSTLFAALGLTPSGTHSVPTSLHTTYNAAEDAPYNVGAGKNPFKTLKDQRVPIEIKMKTRKPIDYSGSDGWYEEAYVDCWLSSYSKTIASNTITITEQATIQYSDIYVAPVNDTIGGTTGNTPAADSRNATGRVLRK
ncbi:virion structural protein [Bacillus phage G]|uniref:Gp179 n=1 Tax=Bacillus phage G TaxID=2884420 RepID=G3MBP5_9CAUD|nr:virion structural protein [Bacillus phage G]AEO93439.1 gp179 [Bacillus phage G]